MKMTRILVLAFTVVFSVGVCSCSKDSDDNDATATNNGGLGDVSLTWVDLRLPSGLLWASCNVGAESPEDCGDYFAWGDTAAKGDYSWATYRYGAAENLLTKYCFDASYGLNGFTDDLTTLQAMDDAATVQCGGGARMPTIVEWEELFNNTTSTWTSRNGVFGRLLTNDLGRSIFLPAAGYRTNGDTIQNGEVGCYWTSSLYTGNPGSAWSAGIDATDMYYSSRSRENGYSVRAVRSAQ